MELAAKGFGEGGRRLDGGGSGLLVREAKEVVGSGGGGFEGGLKADGNN